MMCYPILVIQEYRKALAGDARLTEFRTFLTGPIVAEDVPPGFLFDVEYNTDPGFNSCRPEMSSDSQETPADHWQPGCNKHVGGCGYNWRRMEYCDLIPNRSAVARRSYTFWR